VSVVVLIQVDRGSSPTVREGVANGKAPSLTVGLLPCVLHPLNKLTRRCSFNKADSLPSTRGFYFFTSVNLIQRVVAAFYQ